MRLGRNLALALAAAIVLAAAIPASAQVLTTVPPVTISYYGWGTPSSPMYPSSGAGQVPFTVEVVTAPTGSGAPTVVDYATLNLTGTPLTNSTGGYIVTAAPTQMSSNVYLLTFYIQIPPGAPPGPYNATLNVYYSQATTTTSSSGATTVVNYYVYSDNLTVTVYQRPSASVEVRAPDIYAGGIGQLVVLVNDTGPFALDDLTVSVQSELPLVGGNASSLGELAPGSSAAFRFYLSAPQSQPPGYYPVQVIVGYWSGGAQYSSTYYARVDVMSQVGSLYAYAVPSTIPYQRNDSVTIYVVNGLSGAVGDVVASLEPSQEFFIAQGYRQFDLGSLPPGSSSAISLNVIPLASSPGPSNIELQVSYVDPEGVQRQAVLTVPIYLEGLADVSFSQVSASPSQYANSAAQPSDVLFNGSMATVSGILLNTGTDEAYYGYVYVNGSIVGNAQPEYVGNLPTNSPTPFSVSFYVPPDVAPGFYTVHLAFSYQDELGNAHAVSYQLLVQVVPAPSAQRAEYGHGSAAAYALTAVVVAVAVAVSVVAARRRRRESQA